MIQDDFLTNKRREEKMSVGNFLDNASGHFLILSDLLGFSTLEGN